MYYVTVPVSLTKNERAPASVTFLKYVTQYILRDMMRYKLWIILWNLNLFYVVQLLAAASGQRAAADSIQKGRDRGTQRYILKLRYFL